jgi:hypothetical protein
MGNLGGDGMIFWGILPDGRRVEKRVRKKGLVYTRLIYFFDTDGQNFYTVHEFCKDAVGAKRSASRHMFTRRQRLIEKGFKGEELNGMEKQLGGVTTLPCYFLEAKK